MLKTRRSAEALIQTERFATTPAASVSGIYRSHPQARYFNLGRYEPDARNAA